MDLTTLLLFTVAVACFIAYWIIPDTSSSSPSAAAKSKKASEEQHQRQEQEQQQLMVVEQRRQHREEDDAGAAAAAADDGDNADDDEAARLMQRLRFGRNANTAAIADGPLAGLRRDDGAAHRLRAQHQNQAQEQDEREREDREQKRQDKERARAQGERVLSDLRAQREERQKQEMARWKDFITVEARGNARGSNNTNNNAAHSSPSGGNSCADNNNSHLLAPLQDKVSEELVELVRKTGSRIIQLEELSKQCDGLSISVLVEVMQSLVASGKVVGAFDDLGKFLLIGDENLEAICEFIESKGRVTQAELKSYCSELLAN